MTLCRTKFGLANRHILLGVDIVAFVEGGDIAYDFDSVINGKFNISSEDVVFWQKILSIFKPGVTIDFCAVGSKKTIKAIADHVFENNISSCLALMDRDLDSINECIGYNSHCTFGYSWENDVFNEDVINEVVITLARICRRRYKLHSFVRYYLDIFKIHMRSSVFFDVLLHYVGDSFIPRNNTGKGIIDANKPIVYQERVRSLVEMKKESIKHQVQENGRSAINVLSDCYGHLFCHYVCNFIYFIVAKIYKIRIQKSQIKTLAVEKFAEWLNNNEGSHLYAHYQLLSG